MDYRYYLWSAYGSVLLGLGWLLFNTLSSAKNVRQALQEAKR